MNDGDDLETVRSVLARHREMLMELAGVTGTGIGARADGTGYAIAVYLDAPTDNVPGPEELEGVAIQYTVTGGFRSQNLTRKPEGRI